MPVDYNAAAGSYDNTRTADDEVIARFAVRVALTPATCVLDFGCGTGNYLLRLQRCHGCRGIGVEPSTAMRGQARQKLPDFAILAGDHRQIPLADMAVDFAYLTDVVHHVSDRAAMFAELGRVLKPSGALCIVTQSHEQIAARFFNRFFPSLQALEQSRHPRIETLIAEACAQRLTCAGVETLPLVDRDTITPQFVRNVAEKNWSMFRLLAEDEFERGLAQVRSQLGMTYAAPEAGRTLLWFTPSR